MKVSTAEVESLKENPIRYIVNQNTGDVTKINIAKSPLLIREFGVKKINNKLITGGLVKKGFYVSKEPIPLNIPITGTLYGVVIIEWVSSGNNWPVEVFIELNKEILQSREEAEARVMEYILGYHMVVKRDLENGNAMPHTEQLSFFNKNDVELEFGDMTLYGNPLNLCRLYGESVDLNNSNDNNCVKNYMVKTYSKISKTKKLPDDGITANEIKEFCEQYRIKMILFDINKNVICQTTPQEKNKSYKNLVGIAYNNHFYPIANKELHRVPKPDTKKLIYSANVHHELIRLLKEGEYPNNIELYLDEIKSLQVGETMYHSNIDYDTCSSILDKLGLGDKMTVFTNKQNICKSIEKLFFNSSVDSYFPYHSNEGGYSFFNENFDDTKSTTTIDHNKHYSDALRKLKKLIVVDIKTAIHIDNPTELKDGFFYIAKPRYSNILMPITGFYSYDFLKYCQKEGVEFELVEAMSCSYTRNYYTEMINTLYEKLSNEDFKFVVNCMIGQMEKKADEKTRMKFIKIANEDETKTTDKYVRRINDEYNIIYDIEKVPNKNILNKVPIRVQALCEARKIVYEKIKELKLGCDDIKQIRTDAITFHCSKKIKSGNNIGEWKVQEPTLYKSVSEIVDHTMTFKLQPINKTNTIFIDYAGSGKTHYIVNSLIPTLDDYIVVSPSNASITEYRSKGINCNVIQKYSLSHTIPKEQNIIIDEIGMLDDFANKVLIKSASMGKNIYSFGDFKQMKPVSGEPCDSLIYLNYMYGNIKSLGTNYRNDFTFEYYDQLFNMTDKKEILKEIKKYNTKNFYDAECIITYTNVTKDKYNKMMSDKLGINFGDIGCKIVCKTNDLKDKDLYNNKYCIIKAVDKKEIIITDNNNDITITSDELKKHFELGYCRTLYNIQGESCKSFYFPVEDINFIDGRAVYTLISRLKK